MKSAVLTLILAPTIAMGQFNPDKCHKCVNPTFRAIYNNYCQKCDSLNPPGPPVQAFDADTLFFHNETEIRDWCAAYDMGWWEVQPPQFDYYQTIEEVVPYQESDGCTETSPAPSYWYKPDDCMGKGWLPYNCIPDGVQFLHEELYYGLQYCSFRDHLHLNRFEKVQRPCFCPEGDLFGVTEYITNPFTGQVAVFHDIYRWSNRYGYNIWNENLVLYMIWPELGGANTVTFQVQSIHDTTGCDYTFSEFFPGHEEMTLKFIGQKRVDGVVQTVTIGDIYDSELGR